MANKAWGCAECNNKGTPIAHESSAGTLIVCGNCRTPLAFLRKNMREEVMESVPEQCPECKRLITADMQVTRVGTSTYCKNCWTAKFLSQKTSRTRSYGDLDPLAAFRRDDSLNPGKK